MELEELKNAWSELDRRVTANTAELQAQRTSVKLSHVQSLSHRVIGLPVFDLLGGILSAGLVGSFLFGGPHELKFVLPAVVLDLFAILTVAMSARQIAQIGMIDFSGSVIDIQGKLAEVRRFRIRVTQWTFLLAPLLWMPLATVVAIAFLKLDVYRAFGWPYVISNYLFGGFVLVAAIWIAKRFEKRFANSAILRVIADSVAGRSLTLAQRSIAEIAEFARN